MIEIERQTLKKFAGKGFRATFQLEPSLSELYHENTKLSPMSSRAYGAWIGQVGSSSVLKSVMRQPYKVYTLMDQVALASTPPRNYLESQIAARRSIRTYTGESLSQEELARLLFYSYGRTDKRLYYRAVPSGGALYPLEIYAVPLNVEGLERGIYHYNVEHHCLDVVRRCDRLEEFKQSIWFEDIHIDDAAVLFLITAIFQRCTLKYQDRGYRMVLIEAGEVGQNMILEATALGLGSCLVGGFHDDTVSELLEIDGVSEAPLLPVVVGRVAAGEPAARNGEGSW